MKKIVIALPMVALLLAACGGGQGAAPAAESASSTPSAIWMPYGYQEAIPGVGVKWMEQADTNGTCADTYAPSCFGVEVVSNTSCPDGLFIELALLDEQLTIVGKGNEITAAISPGDHLKVAVVGTVDAPKAKITQVNCLGS